MTARPFRGKALAAALLFAVALGGCGISPASRFYTLSSLRTPEKDGISKAATAPFVTGVGPVTIPDYLDRPQIALRISGNELELGEFDRWAGSLRNDVSRVVTEDLSVLLADDGITVVSWREGIPLDCRLAVDLGRFDVRAGTDVLLKARWSIFAAGGKGLLLTRETEIVEPLSGGGYAPAVDAMGRALEGLGREMAEGIRSTRQNLTVDNSGEESGRANQQ